MQNPKHCAPVAMMILIILAILLTACGATLQYGIVATLTPAPTVTPTPLPSAEDAVVKFNSVVMTRDYTEAFDAFQARVCKLTTETGCKALDGTFKTIKSSNPKYKVQTGVDITNPVLLGSGILEGGKIWQAWQVDAKYTKPWAGLRSNDLHPAGFYSWVDGEWKYDGLASQSAVDLLVKSTPAPTEVK